MDFTNYLIKPMTPLFSKENFSAELKDLLGFVDADIKFNRLKPSIDVATEEIIDLIGYESYESSFSNKELGQLIKYAVALNAYIIYAPTADLSVTNNGRLMRRDDHQVAAFEWQIDANNDALIKLYYKHLDRLLKYMVQNDMKINLEKYNHSELIVPNLATFETFFHINGSHLLYLKLLPAIREFEKNEMMPRLGKDLFSDRQKLAVEGILYWLQSACVSYAMAWGLRRVNIKIFPSEVVQNASKNKSQKQGLEHLETAIVFEKDVERMLLKIEQSISKMKKSSSETSNEADLSVDIGFDAQDGFVNL